jgi:hypothetical protein
MAKNAWRNWYHCTVSTYGTWLPGDPRGWRERNHHEHVQGDYKTPPKPSKFNAGRFQHSKDIMKDDPYLIAASDREPIGHLLIDSFHHRQIPLSALAVCEKNFHVLIQVSDGAVKQFLGLAKRHVTFTFAPIINDGTNRRVRIWEGEGGVNPINDESHARNAHQYILDHINEGGWIWSNKDALFP